MKIIQNNPYRQLGVYANSPIRERVVNHNRLNAFLKVGRQVDFPLDLTRYLPPINRTFATISQANASLALPKEQLKYAQFWFLKVTPLDDIAFNHLYAGDIKEAVSIWEKKDNASSLQNRIVCALINEAYSNAITYAELLYSQYVQQFVSIVIGYDGYKVSSDVLVCNFLDVLCEELGGNVIRPIIKNESWFNHINKISVNPLINKIQASIDLAKVSKGKGSIARYDAGNKLMNDTKGFMKQLKTFLPTTNLQYQTIADKLGLEILQCGIDFFNKSEDKGDAAYKAMTLQRYAMGIVVGKMAKERCKENMDRLQEIIENLPPEEVLIIDKMVNEKLRKFSIKLNSTSDLLFRFSEKKNEDNIKCADDLLKELCPHLQTIKNRLSMSSSYYLKMSDMVVEKALNVIIIEINKINDYGMYLSREQPNNIESLLRKSWIVIEYIYSNFDMSNRYKQERFMPIRHKFIMLCDGCGINVLPFLYRIKVSKGLLYLMILMPLLVWLFIFMIKEL